jgi:hypothetical protein
MSAQQYYLTTGEFHRSMEALRVTITGRCDKIDSQLDDHIRAIAIIEDRLDLAKSNDKNTTRKNASGWSAGVAGVIIGAVELIKALAN